MPMFGVLNDLGCDVRDVSDRLFFCPRGSESVSCFTFPPRGRGPAAAGVRRGSPAVGRPGGPLDGVRAGGGRSGGGDGAAEGQAGGRRAAGEEDGAAGRGTPPTAAESAAAQPAGHERADPHEHPHP